MITFFYLKKIKKIHIKNIENIQSTTIDTGSGKKIALTIILFFYSTIISIPYIGGYTYWLHNYREIDDYIKFCLNFLKTFKLA